MWNGSISLPVKKISEKNANGFEENEIYEFAGGIPANFTDVTRNDEILAYQKGYTVDQNIEIVACNYSGQSFLVDDSTGEIYDIRRTYRKDKSMMLTMACEKRKAGR